MNSVTDTARVLLTAAIVSAVALLTVTWRLTRTAPGSPARLVAQLHLAQWAAIVLVVQGALTLGAAITADAGPHVLRDAVASVLPIIAGLLVLRSEPVTALQMAAVSLGLHAAFAFAHRDGGLAPDLAPGWFWFGQMSFSLYVATLCSVSCRR